MRETLNIRTQVRQSSFAGDSGTVLHTHWRIALIALILGLSTIASAQNLAIGQATGGVGFFTIGNIVIGSFGTMNALAVGSPSAGVTDIALNNGALYYTPYALTVSGLAAGHKASITAYVSTNFAHPAALVAESCPYTSACNASGQYAVMSTVAGAPTNVVAAPGIANSTVTAGVALFLPDNNGASAYTGNDTAQITLTLKDLTSNTVVDTITMFLTFPQETVQNAVSLTLGTAPGGATIVTAADFSLNFGNVNALGIGPGAGLTTTSVAGGMVYHTPYLLNPAFSAMNSTTATIKVYVSTNFAHPALLVMDDASSSGGPYSAISTNAGAQTQITAAAADRSSITRYLGLFVSNVNGATAFNGSDTATLTFTLTVP